MTEMFWDMAMNGFSELITEIAFITKRSLTQTNEVLFQRKSLENNIITIRPQIDEGINKLNSMMRIIKTVEAKKDEINASKNFEMTQTVPKTLKVDLPAGRHTTTCLNCNRTCHLDCSFADDKDKIKCCAMKQGHCTVCPQKCKWNDHANRPYRYEISMVSEVVTAHDLKQKYVDATSKKTQQVQILEGLMKDFVKHQNKVKKQISDVYLSLQKLRQIALVPSALDVPDYFTILILSEQDEKKFGWEERVASLAQMKKNSEFLYQITQPEYDPYKDQVQEVHTYIKELEKDGDIKPHSNFLQKLGHFMGI
jgi:hypothetical protein